jgi:hypothetical protein
VIATQPTEKLGPGGRAALYNGRKMSFDDIWSEIQRLAGQTFYLLGGATFTYRVDPDSLLPSTQDRAIPRRDFERVHAHGGEIPPPRTLKRMGFQDAAYIFSILTDPRLRRN